MRPENELNVPEGYFEESYVRTMRMAAKLRRRRRSVLIAFAALLVAGGSLLVWNNAMLSTARENYLAEQKQQAQLDIFMEIN